MDYELNDVEVRVLGSIIEKEFSTPEYYPLSLNALINACNQKTSREPVVNYNEDIVMGALSSLRAAKIVWRTNTSRVAKYEETFIKSHNFSKAEAAVMCTLMLKGPQTAGEIKLRAEKINAFASLEDLGITIESLKELGFLIKLEKQPGQKDARYCHLLSGEPVITRAAHEIVFTPPVATSERISALEEEINNLRQELGELKQDFLDLKRQFE